MTQPGYLGQGLQCRPPVLWSERAVVWLHRAWGCSGDPQHRGLCEPHKKPLPRAHRPCSSRSRAPSSPACSLPGREGSRSASVEYRGHSGWALAPPPEMTSPPTRKPKPLLPQKSASRLIQTSPSDGILRLFQTCLLKNCWFLLTNLLRSSGIYIKAPASRRVIDLHVSTDIKYFSPRWTTPLDLRRLRSAVNIDVGLHIKTTLFWIALVIFTLEL